MTKKFEEYELFDDTEAFCGWASQKKQGEFTLVLKPRGSRGETTALWPRRLLSASPSRRKREEIK
ncbi:hypothetical protein FP828_08895 [bacterium]|nr:hypothetical protein [bacterium]